MHVSGLSHVPLALKGMQSQWGHWFGLAHAWGGSEPSSCVGGMMREEGKREKEGG